MDLNTRAAVMVGSIAPAAPGQALLCRENGHQTVCAPRGAVIAGAAGPLLAHAATMRPQAVYSPHALIPAEGRRLVHDVLLPGETLAAYLDRSGLAAAIGRQPVRVTIDGYRVPRELWARVRPKPGTMIGISAVLHGGGGKGKNPIATILSLAILVFNPGAALLGLAGIANTAIIGTLTLAGVINAGLGLVVSAVFAPPAPNISDAQGQRFNTADSPTYSLSGGANRARMYEPLPMIAGTHRISPDLGARAYTEFEGDDQYLYQVFCFGFNTVTLSDWKIGATALTAYNGVTMETSTLDGVLTLFPGNVDTISGGTMDYNVYLQRTSSPGTTAIALDIAGNCFAISDNGEIQGAAYTWTAEYRAVGSATWLPFVGASASINGSGISGSRTPIRRTFRREVTEGQYEVRVSSQTTGYSSAYTVDFAWTQMRSYQPDTADYTGQQRVALKIKASGQLNGSVDTLSAVARAQCEVWTGAAWVEGETSNPAWWFRAIALGRFVTINGRSVRVWGAGLASTRVDHEAIKAWGTWCDSKALTFNGVFDRAISAADMLQALATCGRASPSWANGKLGIVYDQAALPVTAVFGMSNILAGSFGISYQTEQLADEIIVGFINPDIDWQRDTVRCLAPGVTVPTITRQIELFGCTNLDMAGRAGNLYAAQQTYRARTYNWRSDFEGMAVSRGDVVQLSHDLASFDYSGRLVEGSTASVLKLERAVPLPIAGAYIVLVKPDQTFATHAVVGGAGTDTDTLTLVTALAFNPGADPAHPVYDYKWLFGATATPGKLVKIDTLKPLDESTVEITAIDELEAFYLAEDATYTYTPPRPVFGSPTISNLAVIENGVRVAQGYLVALTVTWDAGADYAGAEVWAAVNDGPELLRATARGRQAQFTVGDGDVVAIRLVALSTLGRLGLTTQLTITHTTSFADNFPPVDVTTFLVNGSVLSWLPVADVDVAGYRIKFNLGTNLDWSGATRLHEGLLTASPWQMPVRPSGAITLMIRAVDVAGIESVNSAAIYTDLGEAATARVVETIDLDALGYPGTITAGSVSGGDLVADSGTAFWNTNETAGFWAGAESSAFWPVSTYFAMTYVATVTPTMAWSGAQMTINTSVAGSVWTIEYRGDNQNPYWSTISADPFWGADADAFWPPRPDYQPWPGQLAVINAAYDLRISTAAGAVQGVVSTFTVDISVPVISERLNDVVITAGSGSRLPITLTYQAIDNVQVTVQADGNGAIGARIDDKSATLGPLIKTFDAGGSAVAGLIDAYVQGYAP